MDAVDAGRIRRAVWNGLETSYDKCRRAVFEPRARDLVAHADFEAGDRVLDLGTGTGIAAFEARRRVGAGGVVVGVDSSDGLLRAAGRKAARRGVSNVAFLQTTMIALALPDGAFDRVIANYSICCSPSYERTLREAHRVLRSGGTLTYNHEGPHLHPVTKAFKDLLEQHRLKDPPPDLRRVREATAFVEEGWAAYKDPFVTLRELKAVGFRETTATISSERQAHRTVEAYVDYKLTGSVEFAALSPTAQTAFRDALEAALRPHLTDAGLVLEQDVLTFHGVKSSTPRRSDADAVASREGTGRRNPRTRTRQDPELREGS